MAILNNSNAISTGGYDVNNSVRIRSSASAYFNRTPASAGNRQKFTYSVWHKSSLVNVTSLLNANSNSSNTDAIYFDSNKLVFESNVSGVNIMNLTTSQVFRDPSAWYHFVFSVDTTQATAANRIKIYVNGQQITVFTTATYPSQNSNLNINSNVAHNIGRFLSNGGSTYYSDGYYAETHFIDGQALTPSSFGETDTTTGSWKPKAYTSTYGTNGFYLKFSDIATTSGSNAGLGKDFSGNANYWTTNNISVTAGSTYDAMIDSPTLTSATVANYAVMSPLQNFYGSTISNGNLTVVTATANGGIVMGTIGMSSGKWYWEVTLSSGTSSEIGINNSNDSLSTSYLEERPFGYSYLNGGLKYNNSTGSSYGATYTTGDTIGVAFDADAGSLTFYKNGTSQGVAYTGLTNTPYSPAISDSSGGAGSTFNVNFGQRPFAYTPPTGYVRLNAYNLPDSTIKKGNTVMDATLFTGNNSTNTITNAAGFKPDFVWTKSRVNAYNHDLYDSVRGINRTLFSNSTNAESTLTNTLTSFNSNGFTLGVNDDANFVNGSAAVAWQWQAGQGSASSNTSGSITSTVSVNATAGFSVVTYTGTGANATVGHGLGVAPKWVLVKSRTTAENWMNYHTSIGATKYIYLDGTGAAVTLSTIWNNTAPTSSVFSIGTNVTVNQSSTNYVAYCWAEIAGFSKFGSYTGNGSADGPFVYTGFRPKYVMIKRTDGGTNNWVIFDSSRNTYNATGKELKANTSAAEYDGDSTNPNDFLSNGLKIRHDGTAMNIASGTYIYMAFAENPFKNSNAR